MRPRRTPIIFEPERPRVIVHIDMDAFFASVEQRDNPALRGKPVAVGGMHRGVVAAASYEARKFGVHSALSMRLALGRCPGLQVVPPRRAKYLEASEQAFAIFARYTPLIEPLSLDEAFLDVTGSEALFGDGPTIAQAIRQAIAEELHLPASAGVAPNKFMAKLACDSAKPDGLRVVRPADTAAFLYPLAVERVFGVGPVAAARLRRVGIATLQDAARTTAKLMHTLLGAQGDRIRRLAQGHDPRPVIADAARKSISHESTLAEDVTSPEAIERELLEHAMNVAARLRHSDLCAQGVQVKLKDSAFRIETRQVMLDRFVRDPDALYDASRALLSKFSLSHRTFRLCGLGAFALRPGPPPRELFIDADRQRRERIEAARGLIEDRFGRGTLTRATLLRPHGADEALDA